MTSALSEALQAIRARGCTDEELDAHEEEPFERIIRARAVDGIVAIVEEFSVPVTAAEMILKPVTAKRQRASQA